MGYVTITQLRKKNKTFAQLLPQGGWGTGKQTNIRAARPWWFRPVDQCRPDVTWGQEHKIVLLITHANGVNDFLNIAFQLRK